MWHCAHPLKGLRLVDPVHKKAAGSARTLKMCKCNNKWYNISSMLNKISNSGDVTKWCIIHTSLHTIYVIRYGFARCFCWREVWTPFIKGVCSVPNLYQTILIMRAEPAHQSQVGLVWFCQVACRKWERRHFSVDTWQKVGGMYPNRHGKKDMHVGSHGWQFQPPFSKQLHCWTVSTIHRSRDADPLMRAAAAQGMTRRVAAVATSHWEHDPLPLWLILFNCIGTTIVVVISKTVYDKMIMCGPQYMELW